MHSKPLKDYLDTRKHNINLIFSYLLVFPCKMYIAEAKIQDKLKHMQVFKFSLKLLLITTDTHNIFIYVFDLDLVTCYIAFMILIALKTILQWHFQMRNVKINRLLEN